MSDEVVCFELTTDVWTVVGLQAGTRVRARLGLPENGNLVLVKTDELYLVGIWWEENGERLLIQPSRVVRCSFSGESP